MADHGNGIRSHRARSVLGTEHGFGIFLTGCGFFLIHNFRMRDTIGVRLAADLTERPRVVTAIGVVISEPKIAPNGFATFLLRLESIEFDGEKRSTAASLHNAFGDGQAVISLHRDRLTFTFLEIAREVRSLLDTKIKEVAAGLPPTWDRPY